MESSTRFTSSVYVQPETQTPRKHCTPTQRSAVPMAQSPQITKTIVRTPVKRKHVESPRSDLSPVLTPAIQTYKQSSTQSPSQTPTKPPLEVQQPRIINIEKPTSSADQQTGQTIQSPKPHALPTYSDSDIKKLLSVGYICIHRSYWEYIPKGAHVRYFKKGPGKKNELFRPGGFVFGHTKTEDGRKLLVLESKFGGAVNDIGYKRFYVAYDDIDEIWKKYPQDSFIEMNLIHSSMVRKDEQIKELITQVKNLTDRLAALEKN